MNGEGTKEPLYSTKQDYFLTSSPRVSGFLKDPTATNETLYRSLGYLKKVRQWHGNQLYGLLFLGDIQHDFPQHQVPIFNGLSLGYDLD
jgi:hypothetical protein